MFSSMPSKVATNCLYQALGDAANASSKASAGDLALGDSLLAGGYF